MGKYYNMTNSCNTCGTKFNCYISGQNPLREYNNEGNWTGSWICGHCSYKPVNKTNKYNRNDKNRTYTTKQLLDNLTRFYNENGRVPKERDLINNVDYPSHSTYNRRFGNLSKALKLAGLDINTMIKHENKENTFSKGRFAEVIVIDYLGDKSVDLSGENCTSPYDGICPHGKIYDVKSSKMYTGCNGNNYWKFMTQNKYKELIEYYYFLAFNEDYTKLRYAWRVPGEVIEKDYFYVGMSYAEFNISNMRIHEITDVILPLIISRGYNI